LSSFTSPLLGELGDLGQADLLFARRDDVERACGSFVKSDVGLRDRFDEQPDIVADGVDGFDDGVEVF
jgi:hypothetical protein